MFTDTGINAIMDIKVMAILSFQFFFLTVLVFGKDAYTTLRESKPQEFGVHVLIILGFLESTQGQNDKL